MQKRFLIECDSRNLFFDGGGLAGDPASWGPIPTPVFEPNPYKTLRKRRILVKNWSPKKDRTMTRSEPESGSQVDSKNEFESKKI